MNFQQKIARYCKVPCVPPATIDNVPRLLRGKYSRKLRNKRFVCQQIGGVGLRYNRIITVFKAAVLNFTLKHVFLFFGMYRESPRLISPQNYTLLK